MNITNCKYFLGTEQVRTVARVITHSFQLANFTHDIALLKLSRPLELDSKYVAPICVPNNYDEFKGNRKDKSLKKYYF